MLVIILLNSFELQMSDIKINRSAD